MDGWMDGRVCRRMMGGCLDGCMDRWMHGCIRATQSFPQGHVLFEAKAMLEPHGNRIYWFT